MIQTDGNETYKQHLPAMLSPALFLQWLLGQPQVSFPPFSRRQMNLHHYRRLQTINGQSTAGLKDDPLLHVQLRTVVGEQRVHGAWDSRFGTVRYWDSKAFISTQLKGF